MIYSRKPINNSTRHVQILDKKFDKIVKKSKTKTLKNFSGRNNSGKITVNSRGGGHKKIYKIVEFNRFKNPVKGVIKTINYDPNRSSNLIGVLCNYNNYIKNITYVLAPKNIKKGDFIESGINSNIKLKIGNSTCLRNIPIGSLIHNINLKYDQKSIFSRSAGNFSKLLQRYNENNFLIRLKSGEKKLINSNCTATLGIVSNQNNNKVNLGKAGRSRWLGIRPSVRGVAKNPVDHPHGGGEGKTSGGRPSVSFKGKITKGKPTRRRKLIIVNEKNYIL